MKKQTIADRARVKWASLVRTAAQYTAVNAARIEYLAALKVENKKQKGRKR